MKLVRYGRAGKEKPALVDSRRKIAGLERSGGGHRRRRARSARARASGQARTRVPARGARRAQDRAVPPASRQFYRRRAQLCRPRGRVRHAGSKRAGAVHQSALLRRWSERRRRDPQGFDKDGLGGGARDRDRFARQLCQRGAGARSYRRLLHLQRRVGTRISARARRPVGEGKELPDFRPARPMARHAGRDQGRASAQHVARRQRRADADGLDRDDGLRRQDARVLYFAVHDSRARRRHHHRHAARRRGRQEAAAFPARRATRCRSASTGSDSKTQHVVAWKGD